jgi:hypothetical protein
LPVYILGIYNKCPCAAGREIIPSGRYLYGFGEEIEHDFTKTICHRKIMGYRYTFSNSRVYMGAAFTPLIFDDKDFEFFPMAASPVEYIF